MLTHPTFRLVAVAFAVVFAVVLVVACASDSAAPATQDEGAQDPASGTGASATTDESTAEISAPDDDTQEGGAVAAVTLAMPGSVTVPDGFPDQMPLPADATSSVTEDATVVGVTLNHPAESAALIAFYEEQLVAHGWDFADSPVAADNPMFTENMRWWDVEGHGMSGSVMISDELAGPTMRVVQIMIDR